MAELIEEGNVYFLYRPKVVAQGEATGAGGVEDVQRLYMVLSPHGKSLYRLVVLGRKRLPDIDEHERLWGFVDKVEKQAIALREELVGDSYQTKTRGERRLPTTRPAGEGVYGIVRHDNHAHFAYVLELPKQPAQVQQTFNIAPEASYVISVKNPKKPSPPSAGLRKGQKAELPKRLQELFRDRRFADPDPPELLDYPGSEFVLVGAREEMKKELHIDLNAQDEDERSAEIFSDLRLRKSRHPLKPLFEGEWA